MSLCSTTTAVPDDKNVNTFNKALREERLLFGSQKANRSVPRSSMKSTSHKSWRSRLLSTERRENGFSVATTVSQVHSAFPSRAEVSSKLGFNALKAVERKQHSSARVSSHEVPISCGPKEGRIPDTCSNTDSNKVAVKRRDVKPKPPPLPAKKSRISSSPINLPVFPKKISDPCSSNPETATSGALDGISQPTEQQLPTNTKKNLCGSDTSSTSSVGCLQRENSSSGYVLNHISSLSVFFYCCMKKVNAVLIRIL
ncbi:hypothetical protein COOONC_06828 [Cooperia oncophora]